MKLKQLLTAIHYEIQGSIDKEISDLCYDSRLYQKGQLFIAIKGEKENGHDHILEVIKKGCEVVVVEEGDYPSITTIRVKDTLTALANLSASFFGHPQKNIELIGITGTSGKTSTSFILKALLETNYRVGVVGTNGIYYNDHFIETNNTTPSSYRIYQHLYTMVKEKIDICIIEVSSQALKQKRVEGLTFKHAILTNISKDHLSPLEHSDMDEYISCKKRLFNQCENAYLNQDDPYYETFKKDITCSLYSYGTQGSLRVEKTLLYFDKSYFRVNGLLCDEFMLSLPSLVNVYNTLAPLCIACFYKIPVSSMKEVLKKIKLEGRYEVYLQGKRTFLIDYAHNLNSYKTLFEMIHSFPFKRVIVVIGAGGNRSKTRRCEVMKLINHYVDYFILTEDNSRNEDTKHIIEELKEGIDKDYCVIYSRKEAIDYAFQIVEDKEIVVIVGKGHERYIEKNNERIPFNDASYLKSLLNRY